MHSSTGAKEPRNGSFMMSDAPPREPSYTELPPPAWLLSQAPSPSKWHAGSREFEMTKHPQPYYEFDARIEAHCNAKPTFRRGVGGTFIADLAGVAVSLTTACDPDPSCCGVLGRVVFQPVQDFFMELPELREVVFEPSSVIPGSHSMTATAHKSVTLLEVPNHHDLKARIHTNVPSGTLVLEDSHYTSTHQKAVSEAMLHFELKANSRISIDSIGGSHCLNVNFDFCFHCWLEVRTMDVDLRSLAPVEQPPQNATGRSSLRLSFASSQAMDTLDSTDEALSSIEARVNQISREVSKTDSCDICELKSEPCQLESQAKKLETKGVDDVYTSELHTGKQLAKDAKKQMLSRFEQLFGEIDRAFRLMREKVEGRPELV